jgi:hypothetical protein
VPFVCATWRAMFNRLKWVTFLPSQPGNEESPLNAGLIFPG